MTRYSKPLSILILCLALIGVTAFVLDVLNPETPIPLIYPRVVVFGVMLIAAIRGFGCVPIAASVDPPIYQDDWAAAAPSIPKPVLELTCVLLR